MLDPLTVAEVKWLLAAGTLSQREIARRTGVCRGTVLAIANGKRRDPTAEADVEPDAAEEICSRPVRCRGCGGRLAVLPCRLCKARAALAAVKRRPPKPVEDLEEIDLELRPEHEARRAELLQFGLSDAAPAADPPAEAIEDENLDEDSADRAA
jgi:transcriptional regulator with XRE-family HTH domain